MQSAENKAKEAVDRLMSLSEEERIKAVKNVLGWISKRYSVMKHNVGVIIGKEIKSIKDIESAGKITLIKKRKEIQGEIDRFYKEIGEKKEQIIACFVYSVKPEFVEEYVKLIEELFG